MLNRFSNKFSIIRIFIFLLVALIISLLFSKERKFRFDFKKNTPWVHENLYSSFDFTVNKLPEEYQREIDSIKNNSLLYFEFDASVEKFSIENFKNNYEKNLNSFFVAKLPSSKKFNKDLFKQFENEVIILLRFLYNKGIYNNSEVYDFLKKDNFKIVFKKDTFIKTYLNDQVFDEKTSINYITYSLGKYYNGNYPDYFKEYINAINFKDFIKTNLIFNRVKSDEIKEQNVKSASKTAGYKKVGELIIARGEIVDLNKYRTLLSYKDIYENRLDRYTYWIIFLSQFLFTLIILWIFILFVRHNYKNIFRRTKTFFWLMVLILFFVFVFKFVNYFKISNIYLLPLAILPITIKTFYDERLALFGLLVTTVFISLTLHNTFDFFLIQFFSGTAAILVIPKLTRRELLYFSSISVFVSMSIVYLTLNLSSEGSFDNLSYRMFGYFFINGILVMLSYPFIYGIEKMFGLLSEFTLLELSNTNHSLLQRLSTTAPGTFQHTIEVSSLAEAAANEINCNGLLARVGALYHDIGKTIAPAFFSENQVSGYNPHDFIDYERSAKIIIEHVSRGVLLAKKYNLPEQVIDFIRTHHGTSTAQYFYKHFIMKFPDRADEIDKFTYPGPKPFSKETAIVMMADSIEAASRSLKQHNPESIAEIVEKIFETQMNNKQYEDTNLTFEEIKTLKKFFKQRLLNIYHIRVQYPK